MLRKIAFIAALISGYATAYTTTPFTVGADWLYWKDFENNLDYATHVVSTGASITSSIISPNFAPSNGFRVFAAYAGCEDPWESAAKFVHFHSKTSNATNLDPTNIASDFLVLNSVTFPIFTGVNSAGFTFSNLSSSWNFNFNYLDLDLDYTFCLWSRLQLTPAMGLRGMWIRQTLELNGLAPPSSSGGGTIFSKFKGNFDGYGLKAEIIADGYLGCGFSLVGGIGGSILYAKIKVDDFLSFISPGGVLDISVSDNQWLSCPTFNSFIGINYQNCLSCYQYNLSLGWEQHVIINANHLSILDYTDLTLQGLTLGGSISF